MITDLRTALKAAVAELPTDQLPGLVGLLAETKARVMMRLSPAPPPAATDVVDVATLSAELGLAPSWLRAQARADKLPHLRCGKYIKFRRSEVLAALEHRMGCPVDAEKRSNGGGRPPGLPGSQAEPETGRAVGHE